MKTLIPKGRKFFYTVISLTLICLVLVAISTLARPGRTQQKSTQAKNVEKRLNPWFVNKTQGFTPLGLSEKPGPPTLLLRNDYAKSINGFQIAIEDGVQLIELINADEDERQQISPRETFEFSFQVVSGSATPKITILAVVFEDGTGDGDERFSKQIKELRQGVKIQYSRIMPLLRDALNSSDDADQMLDNLAVNISNLPSGKGNKNLAGYTELGLQSGKETILAELSRIKDAKQKRGNVDIRKAVAYLLNKSEKKLNKF